MPSKANLIPLYAFYQNSVKLSKLLGKLKFMPAIEKSVVVQYFPSPEVPELDKSVPFAFSSFRVYFRCYFFISRFNLFFSFFLSFSLSSEFLITPRCAKHICFILNHFDTNIVLYKILFIYLFFSV